MTATFDPTLNSAISRIRFALGDTDVATAEVQDETINYYLTTQMMTEKAALAALARGIANKYARLADVTVDDQLTRYSHVYKAWDAIATKFEAAAAEEAATPGSETVGTTLYSGIVVNGIGDCRGPLDSDCCDILGWAR